MKYFILALLFFGFYVNNTCAQYQIPDVPKKQTSLYDYSNLLSSSEAISLEEKLVRYSDSTSTQIVLIIVNSLNGEDINYLAANWGEKWAIGQKGKDNGVLLLMVKGDRKVAIQTGRGTEGVLTDLMTKRIIELRIIPEFKRGNYYKGLDRGTDGIFEVLSGEFKEVRKRKSYKNGKGFSGIIPFILIVLLFFAFRNRGGKNGGRRSGSGVLLDILILSSMGRSGGFGGRSSSGGSFGSGGFSGGFGGGSFGGGGASGSW
tara:strand:- start:5093 stop:5872 length:780 start_codon:yes stop_codon:yes gene_type:complete